MGEQRFVEIYWVVDKKVQLVCLWNKNEVVIKGDLGVVLKCFSGLDIIVIDDGIIVRSSLSYQVLVSKLKCYMLGVTEGYFVELELLGLGYKFITVLDKKKIIFYLGYSVGIRVVLWNNIRIVGFWKKIVLFGLDLEEVKWIAGLLRNLWKINVYKGKGIVYRGSEIKMKMGKDKQK